LSPAESPLDPDVIRPWTATEDGDRLVLRRPLAPPDLIVGALYGVLAAITGGFGVVFLVRAVRFWTDPVAPWVLGVLCLVSFVLMVWALRSLRSDAVREIQVSSGRIGLGQGGLLGVRRSALTGTQIAGLRILHRQFDDRGEKRRWTELYLEPASMPERFLGFFAGSDETGRERAATTVADRLGVVPVIVHQGSADGERR
jgi:hypothetical protein